METRYILSAILYCFRGRQRQPRKNGHGNQVKKWFQCIHHFLDIVDVLADRFTLEEVRVPVKAPVQEMG